ncbi:hypothetical protein Hanom_Chr04g00302641 [Helianthus anomalus]
MTLNLLMSNSNVPSSPFFTLNKNHKLQYSRVLVTNVASEHAVRATPELFRSNGVDRKSYAIYNDGRKTSVQNVDPEELKPLWDDGYGTQTIKDYTEIAMDLIKSDHGGPPRWFCPVACGKPITNSPVLLYLPGN